MSKKSKQAKPKEVKVTIDKKRVANQNKNTCEGLFNYWLINRSAKYPYFFEWCQLKCHAPKFKAQE